MTPSTTSLLDILNAQEVSPSLIDAKYLVVDYSGVWK